MKINLKFFFILLVVQPLMAFASGESPFSHCELNTRGITADKMEFVDTPSNIKLSSETGIQILTLKRPVPYATINYNFILEPIRLASDKTELANDVVRFLNAFPQDFLIKNQNMCFILVEDTQSAEAMTTKNVVFLPIDASYEAMAHEFMHAVDDIHDHDLDYDHWDEVNGECSYDRNSDNYHTFAEGSLDDQCFSTPYAKTNLWEDRAELFSSLYRNQLSSENPETILNKAAELKRFLRGISPSMNESFWNTRRDFSW